jgi:hypothetical protein
MGIGPGEGSGELRGSGNGTGVESPILVSAEAGTYEIKTREITPNKKKKIILRLKNFLFDFIVFPRIINTNSW